MLPRPIFVHCAVGSELVLRHALHNNVMNETTTKIFPYLERLLDGEEVEWKTLGEVCKIKNGKDYKHLSSGSVPVYGSGGVMKYVNEAIYSQPSVLIPRKGSLNNLFFVDTPFWNVDTIYYTEIDTDYILPKFFYYYLITLELEKLNLAGGVPSLTQSTLNKLSIPIPPLRVQARIVEILDKFTQLEAELEAELEARRKQYAYYRDQLLNFSQYPPLNVNIEWKTLGEIAELYSGLSGKTKEHFQKGNAPYVTYKNIFDNLAVDSSILEMVSIGADERQHAVKYGDVLITGSSENIEEVGMSSVVTFHPEKKIYLNSFSFGIRFHSAVQLSPEFTKYLFRSELLRKQIMKTASGVTRFNVSKKKFSGITLPIPPLSEQRRIVDILDRFDTLTNSISEGLPKEIALRRKQYAYYRDALLSFPRPEVSA